MDTKYFIISFAVTLLSAFSATASPLSPRQSPSTTWTYCNGLAVPSNFQAFITDACKAQLTVTKDRYIGIQWAFEARYADGSTAVHTPLRDFANFGVSDTFYPFLGNNFNTRLPGASAFTAVHEFENVCKGGADPVSWRFYTTSANTACSSANYRFTSNQIAVKSGVTRPAKAIGVQMRRTSTTGDFEITWQPVAGASAYSVIVQYPTGTDDVGDPYLNVRGARAQVSFA